MYVQSGFVTVKYVDYETTLDIAAYERDGLGISGYNRIRLANAKAQTLKEGEVRNGKRDKHDREAR